VGDCKTLPGETSDFNSDSGALKPSLVRLENTLDLDFEKCLKEDCEQE
jgi:hypothetical protein